MNDPNAAALIRLQQRELDLPWRSMDAGEVSSPMPETVSVLSEGEVEVHAQAGLLEFREGPALIVEAARVRARSPATLAEVPLARLVETLGADGALGLLCEETRRLERWRHDQLRRDDDFFADDQGGLVPGPYRFGPYEALSVVMRGPTAHTLPRGLRPIPGLETTSMLVFSKVERCRALHAQSDHRDHGYREVATFVPCLGPRLRPGFYLPEVYPDAYLPILLGREVYGFTKRMGRILEHPRGYDLIAGGTHRLRVRVGPQRPAPNALEPVMQVYQRLSRWVRPRLYLRKRLLDVQAGARARNRVDELVALPFSLFHLEPVDLCSEVDVEFPDGRWTLPGTARGALRLRLGFSFEDGVVVRRPWWRGRR